MVIPMKGQYEQQCNAAALNNMGIPVLKNLKKKQLDKIVQWVADRKQISVSYPDMTGQIIDNIIQLHSRREKKKVNELGNTPYSVKKLKQLSLEKILQQNAS